MKRTYTLGAAVLMLAAAVLVFGLGASARHSQNSNSNSNSNSHSNMNHNSNSGASMLASSDRKFMMEAAMGGMMEVEAGRLASQRASNDEVKRFGERMVEDHTKANEELMQLAASKGITLPTGMSAKEQADMAKLSALSGDAFDRMYVKEMVKDHKKDVGMFQKESTSGKDADLRAFAAKTLPTLQSHLSMIQDINNKMSSTGGSSKMKM